MFAPEVVGQKKSTERRLIQLYVQPRTRNHNFSGVIRLGPEGHPKAIVKQFVIHQEVCL